MILQKLSKSIHRFAPPNLALGLSAALLSLLQSAPLTPPGLLLLLPSCRIPPPLPRREPRQSSSFLEEEWGSKTLQAVTDAVKANVVGLGTKDLSWKVERVLNGRGKGGVGDGGRSKGGDADAGMYI